ncbi:MAG: LysE family translocator [Planktomarina sp.]|nr:LysE family translocator [Planktomarina sp.]
MNMTATFLDLALYVLAVLILFLTPGPVWIALLARSMSGGFQAAWPLALGVAVGDAIWPILAILGVSWLVNEIDGVMVLLRFSATLIFVIMGTFLIFNGDRNLGENSRLTRPGISAGLAAGIFVILGNPKAIIFYMGVLPSFFDLKDITGLDIVAIVSVSVATPLLGNLILAGFVNKIRSVLTSSRAVARINKVSGSLLIFVGLMIPFV